MTSEPIEPDTDAGRAATDVPAGDLGVGGPDRPGPDEYAQTPPGYPDAVDATEGPVAGRDGPDVATTPTRDTSGSR
jgi:hypothetical protein